MWDIFVDLWQAFKEFMDRIVGWLYYVLGEAEDPYVYKHFWETETL